MSAWIPIHKSDFLFAHLETMVEPETTTIHSLARGEKGEAFRAWFHAGDGRILLVAGEKPAQGELYGQVVATVRFRDGQTFRLGRPYLNLYREDPDGDNTDELSLLGVIAAAAEKLSSFDIYAE